MKNRKSMAVFAAAMLSASFAFAQVNHINCSTNGTNNSALGENCNAIGDWSFTSGISNQAIADRCNVFGVENYNYGSYSFTNGASTQTGSSLMNPDESGYFSVTFGEEIYNYGNRSFAFGYDIEIGQDGTHGDEQGYHAFASGESINIYGNFSYARGRGIEIGDQGQYGDDFGYFAFANGEDVINYGRHSFAWGHEVMIDNVDNAYVFGTGDGGGTHLLNDIENSFMVGFDGNPVFFVDGNNSSIGIGTISPLEMLHNLGNTRTDGTYLVMDRGSSFYMTQLTNSNGSADYDIGLRFQGVPNILDMTNSYGKIQLIPGSNGTLSSNYVTIDAQGKVGIGKTTPSYELDVNGTAQVTGFIMPTGASNGYVLTSNASGVASWQPAAGADNDWTINGTDMYSNLSVTKVGIGTTTPAEVLDVNGKIKASNFETVSYCTFIGDFAGASNTTGFYNTFVGRNAGSSNTGGNRNAFVGRYAGDANTTGEQNTFVGDAAGWANSYGNANVFLGRAAGSSNSTGSNNVFLGDVAGTYTTTGTGNVFIGYKAGYFETGSNKLYIANSNTSTPLIYGDFSTGRMGINTTSLSYTFNVAGDIYCTGSYQGSDKRYKSNITTITSALDKVRKLRGTTYAFKTEEFKSKNFTEGNQYGFIAQELKDVLPELVKQDDEGYYAVNYNGVIPVLTEAIKEQQSIIDEQNDKIEEQNAINQQQQLLIEELSSKIETLEKTMGIGNDLNNTNTKANLYQNNPNPFNQQTEINYYLADNVNNAAMLVFDMNGKQLKRYELITRGNDKVIIHSNEFAPGMYMYSLIADGKLVDTKRMILTE